MARCILSELPVTRPESGRHATFDRVRSAFTCVILLLAAAFALGQQSTEISIGAGRITKQASF